MLNIPEKVGTIVWKEAPVVGGRVKANMPRQSIVIWQSVSGSKATSNIAYGDLIVVGNNLSTSCEL